MGSCSAKILTPNKGGKMLKKIIKKIIDPFICCECGKVGINKFLRGDGVSGYTFITPEERPHGPLLEEFIPYGYYCWGCRRKMRLYDEWSEEYYPVL
jgi:hypothetical protein